MRLRDLDLWTVGVVAAGAIVAALIGAALVVFLGLFNVSARDGHWPGVSWVLHTTFENSAELRAPPASEAPANLDSPAMVALGAGHFMSGCAMCHGAPGVARSATVQQMLPVPPHLSNVSEKFDASELFWIVHNGIKMSGMPAWPANRRDEVWPVVAFLQALPEMTPDEYSQLTSSETGFCAVCHGAGGVSENPHVPRLDILSKSYIAQSLAAYKSGARDSGIMAEALSHLPRAAIPDVAADFAATAPRGSAAPRTAEFDAGRALAFAEGDSHSVPACRACHGPWSEPLNPAFPSIAGQHAPYLEQQLRLWRKGNRGGGRAAELMYKAARDLTDEQISALAAYYSGLAPARLNDVAE
ncbi:class I triheme cytochrome c [Roseovarius spongiae]|uniref:Class I triheme cytochrome c n=1 Tax=Roseovarius spongiae TaxID=2320272 RepID=A0A3A8ARQ6_9RHOB|nr:c-type cytochrome [Roseovarius spongiae]RKF12716.1 class I triheme cytochrome c [Roseovarius spongiae]